MVCSQPRPATVAVVTWVALVKQRPGHPRVNVMDEMSRQQDISITPLSRTVRDHSASIHSQSEEFVADWPFTVP